jgi:hypothetical protein
VWIGGRLHGDTIPFSYFKAGIYDVVSHEKLFNNRGSFAAMGIQRGY